MHVSVDADSSNRPLTERNTSLLPSALSTGVAVLLVISFIAASRLDNSRVPNFIGEDAINLLVGLPVLAGAMHRARRKSLAGLLVWMGALLHLAYSHALYVLGARSVVLLPIYVVIVAMSLYALLDLLVDIDADAAMAAFSRRTQTRVVGGFLAVTALLLVSRWNSDVASTIVAWDHQLRGPHLVGSLNLLVAMSALLSTSALLWQRRSWGFVLAGLLLPNAAFLGMMTVVASTLPARHGGQVHPLHIMGAIVFTIVSGGLTVGFMRSIERSAASLPAHHG